MTNQRSPEAQNKHAAACTAHKPHPKKQRHTYQGSRTPWDTEAARHTIQEQEMDLHVQCRHTAALHIHTKGHIPCHTHVQPAHSNAENYHPSKHTNKGQGAQQDTLQYTHFRHGERIGSCHMNRVGYLPHGDRISCSTHTHNP